MPPFNPAMIGAPSPVGRGGGGGDVPLGGLVYSDGSPIPSSKYTLCNDQLVGVDTAVWPFALAGDVPAGLTTRRTIGSINDGNAPPPVFFAAAGVFVWTTFSTGPLWVSVDGDTWTQVANFTGGSGVRAVRTFGNKLYVLCDNGLYVTSDGYNYAKVIGANGGYNLCASPGLLYIAGGNIATDSYSFDGVNFTSPTHSRAVFGNQCFYTFWVPAANMFVVCVVESSNYNLYYVSKLTSGNTQQYINQDSNTPYDGVEYFNGLFLLAGGSTFRYTKDFLTRTNCTFTSASSPVANFFVSGGQAFISGNGGAIHFSYDGKNFLNAGGSGSIGEDYSTRGGAAGNGKIINMKTNGRVATANLIQNKCKLPPLTQLQARDGRLLSNYMRIAA